MHGAIAHFRSNISRARDLVGLAEVLKAQATSALDISDLWRAAIVLSVSALDDFIHRVTRIGMLEIAKGTRSATDAYRRFSVSLAAYDASKIAPAGVQWLDDEIRDRHGWLSFQQPDKISEAIRHVSSKSLWNEVAKIMSIPTAADVKQRLQLVVDRRNKIAHEADMDPTVPGARWPITSVIAADAIKFIENVVEAILQVITTP